MSGNSNDRWRRCDKLFAADGKLVSTYTFNPSYFGRFYARWRNCEKRLLASSCLSVRPSIRPHGTRLPMGGFSWNLIFAYFSKICSENRNSVQMYKKKRVLYMKAYAHLWYLAEFFLEWEMFKTKVVEKIKTHILSSITFFPERRGVYDIIIIYLSWSWATCWSVPVSRIQKSLQRSAMFPSASWGIAFHYPG